jgi:adenylosuccinate synthase
VNPAVLLDEMDELSSAGIDVSGLTLSLNAHLIMPYHLEMEKVTERFLGRNALGTTKRGIGPAYADRAARVGIRVQDLYDEKILREKLEVVLKERNQILTKVYGRLAMPVDRIVEDHLGYAERLRPHVTDTAKLLHDALVDGRHVLLEGAQGAMLDLDHGTYPFVTSSTPTAGYAAAGSGFGPHHIERVVGITKAYVTRVGAGPFPTEALDEDGERMGERGHEFGTTTGRKRRCGWFDAPVLRFAARLNGLTELVLTKLDVLSGFERVKICVAYRVDGEVSDDVPSTQTGFHHVEPVWEELPGWDDDLVAARSFDDLPKEAQRYIRFVEELGGVPVSIVGVGPAREQSIPVTP